MRKFTDFIIWNHVFFIMEVVYALYICEYILAFLGTLTTYLSIERHRFMYVICDGDGTLLFINTKKIFIIIIRDAYGIFVLYTEV